MDVIVNTLGKMVTMAKEEANELFERCYRKSFKKKEVLSERKSSVDEVYFIEKGLIRVKIIDLAGVEHTKHFAIENQFIADYRSFLTGEESRYILECLEPSEVVVMPREAVEWSYKHMKDGQKLGRLIAEYYFSYMDRRLEHLYTLTALERYNLMSEIFPGLHIRVPQHMIASYLGITPIHLSRIKKQALV